VGIDHVQLACPPGGEPAGRAFYAGVLGLTEVPKPEPLAARGGCWFRGDGFEVHLGVEVDFRPARKAHPALLAADLDGLAAALAGADHAVTWSDELPGVRRFYVDDPFGNRLELVESPPYAEE
jgi:catechol 2,3-dioxygenase-like lactoylglutathione lyase family enzyme